MADWLTNLGRGIDTLSGYLGITGAHRFDAALCIFGGAILIWVGVAVPKAIRIALLGGMPRKQRRHSMTTAQLSQE